MATARGQLEGRSSSCLKKYRIFFIIVITILCVQVYLAYEFFALEDQSRRSSRPSSGEGGSSQPEEGDDLPKGSRQLKLPPDKRSNPDKGLQPQNNRTVRLKLDKKLLNFTPVCDITGREAVSAVTRAHSQICKQRIVNVTCLSYQSLLYPDRLHSSCPHSPGFKTLPKSLGCFKDDKTLRILSGYYAIYKGTNSPEQCAFMCLQSGYPYAGTEYSIECFCGMEEPAQVKRLPDSSCNMKCPGDPKQSCGGYLTINVFSTGIQRFKAQEARNSSVKITKDHPVRIAFLLTVNGRASRQVKRLIKVLYHPSHLYYIHVDARQDYLYREMLDVERTCRANNIKVAKGVGMRHASIWGGASLLTTLLGSAQQMLKHPHQWDFLVNLSESDFPIKSNEHLTDFLTWNRGLNFVKSHGREVQRFITKQGLDKTFVECEARMWRIGDRKLPKGIQVDGGSDWVALSRDFVEYVANPNPDALVTGLLKIFQYTLLPAESFFHTVLRNSRFCDTYVDNNLHVTNWKRKLGCKCQYKAVVDWCGCSPNDFKLEDFTRIRNTAERNLFFARKFEPSIDQRIMDKVEEWLYPGKRNRTSTKGYDMYWQSVYHNADLSPLADDTMLTISHSLARLLFSTLKIDGHTAKLLETIAYFRENRFNAILITAESLGTRIEESSTNENPERFEGMIKMRKNFSVSGLWMERVQSLAVGTDYDQKEQTFRNLVGGIGPLSSPFLAFEFDVSLVTPRNISVLWIDPRGRLADVSHLQLEELTLMGSVKPQLSEPLLIGTWQVLLVADTVLVAQLKFLVVPLAYWKNKKITSRKAKEIHNGPSAPYRTPEDFNEKWNSVLKSVETLFHEKDLKTSNIVEERVGVELDRWIDSLVYEYYEVVDRCYAVNVLSTNKSKLRKCSQTDWSSLSPDSKADIRNLCQNY